MKFLANFWQKIQNLIKYFKNHSSHSVFLLNNTHILDKYSFHIPNHIRNATSTIPHAEWFIHDKSLLELTQLAFIITSPSLSANKKKISARMWMHAHSRFNLNATKFYGIMKEEKISEANFKSENCIKSNLFCALYKNERNFPGI